MNNLLSRFRRDETGVATVQVLVVIGCSAMLLGLAVDSTLAYNRETSLQVTADAAALAAAANITDRETALDLALDLSTRNMPVAANGSVVTSDNVRFGTYDFDTRVFTESLSEDDEDANAVQVIAQRTSGGDNAVGTVLLRLIGRNSFDVRTTSLAVVRTSEFNENDCDAASFVSMGDMTLAGGADLKSGMCLHGEGSIRVGGGAYFDENTRISTVDSDDVWVGGGSKGADLEDVIVEQSLELKLLPQMGELFDAAWAELASIDGLVYNGTALPTQFQGMTVKVLTAETTKLKPIGGVWGEANAIEWQPNTIYVTEGNVTTQGGSHANDFAIVARGDITIAGGNDDFENVMFLSESDVTLHGGHDWGNGTSFCNTGTHSVYMFAQGTLNVAGGAGLYGVLGAASTFNPGGGVNAGGSIYFESLNDMDLGGGYDLEGCEEPLDSYYDISNTVEAPVGAYLVH